MCSCDESRARDLAESAARGPDESTPSPSELSGWNAPGVPAAPEHSTLPGWPVIDSLADLLEHDPMDPAYLLMPPELVAGAWWLLEHRAHVSQPGQLARAIELFLVSMGELQRGADDTLEQAGTALRQASEVLEGRSRDLLEAGPSYESADVDVLEWIEALEDEDEQT